MLKGFILKLNPAKNEDLVVKILSEKSVESYYRFYGARHSVLQLGYLIDFEVQEDRANFLPRVRNITHHPFPWLYNREKLLNWHRFISIFEPHLRDVSQIDSFYFNTLLKSAKKWQKQNCLRVIVESFTDILKFEGRLHHLNRCVICNREIDNEISFIKGMLPTHPKCSLSPALNIKEVNFLFKESSTLFLDDKSVEFLANIVLKGF